MKVPLKHFYAITGRATAILLAALAVGAAGCQDKDAGTSPAASAPAPRPVKAAASESGATGGGVSNGIPANSQVPAAVRSNIESQMKK